jgi:hypothetical protein
MERLPQKGRRKATAVMQTKKNFPAQNSQQNKEKVDNGDSSVSSSTSSVVENLKTSMPTSPVQVKTAASQAQQKKNSVKAVALQKKKTGKAVLSDGKKKGDSSTTSPVMKINKSPAQMSPQEQKVSKQQKTSSGNKDKV